MAKQSARRDRKNQGFPPCFISTLRVMWFRSANSHTGPQSSSLHQEAGQMAASDEPPNHPKIPLAFFGASTDGKRSFDRPDSDGGFWAGNGKCGFGPLVRTADVEHCAIQCLLLIHCNCSNRLWSDLNLLFDDMPQNTEVDRWI